MKTSVTVLITLIFATSAFAQNEQPKTVPYVDLSRYVGLWYEIAAIPQIFQKNCAKNTTAEYSFGDDSLVLVKNSCETLAGEREVANGAARIVDTTSNSKLKVTFVKLIKWIFTFAGDYWVIDLADDYSYAVVGGPTTKYSWILARQRALDTQTLLGIESRLKSNGFDTCKLLMTIQDGANEERKPLCEVIRN